MKLLALRVFPEEFALFLSVKIPTVSSTTNYTGTMATFLLLPLLLFHVSINNAAAFGVQSSRVFVSTPVSKYPKRQVSDCMSPALPFLTPNMSVEEAMAMLLQSGLSGAPVVNEENQVIGIVTSFDFLQKEAFEGALLAIEGSAADVEMYVAAAEKICGQKVQDVMTGNPITVIPDTPMREAAALMTEMRLHRLPVVNDQGHLVGVLTSADVMRDLQHIVRNLPEARGDAVTP
jgi:CBS domain-containing protein